MILAGDIGGTKADLALYDAGAEPRRPRLDRRLATREHASLDTMVQSFLTEAGARPTRAVFGIAGPVKNNRCEATNLPWLMDGDALGETLGAPVRLFNDLETTAWGLDRLETSDLEVLQPAAAADGTRALIAAGTGLGESIVARVDGRWVPIPSEGGHADFAPRDALEDALCAWLRARHGHVSFERILSGNGLADVFRFMSETGRGAAPAIVTERFAGAADPAAIVTETALDGSCERSRLALEAFVRIYGAEAGNLALKALAMGGVFVGGGIAPRILPVLRQHFVPAFVHKGRLTPVLESIPVAVILDPRTSLWGAAALALAPA